MPKLPSRPSRRPASDNNAKPAGRKPPPLGAFPNTRQKPASPYSGKKADEAPESAASKPSTNFGRKAAGPPSGQRMGQTVRAQASRPTPSVQRSPAPVSPAVKLPVPCAMVSRRASEALRGGHLWVYASDIEQVEIGNGDAPGLIPVVDNRGIPLGTALYSPASQIALRLVSRELISRDQWHELLAIRLRTAIDRRKPMLSQETDACRLVFSEADALPGVIIDTYAGIVVLQLLNKGLDSTETRAVCVKILREALGDAISTIWERPDPRIRELEGLSAPGTAPLFSASETEPVAGTVFQLNGLSFHFDVNSGQKTGAFLDQSQNYAAAARWAKARDVKKALDVCTYQGGFALHLAQFCEQVTGIDASRSSLEVAERNLELNRNHDRIPMSAEVDWLEADAFELLRAWSESEEQAGWDMIVLDPPAFAKSKRAVEGALRGYKELNLRALRMIRPGGLLVTCSCSHHVSWTDLEGAVAAAAVDAGRQVTLLERRGASLDHPVLLNLPETEYLKCLICQVD
jgi:23S rRNA (cytosine1962-C5)-methyltransferase